MLKMVDNVVKIKGVDAEEGNEGTVLKPTDMPSQEAWKEFSSINIGDEDYDAD